MVWGGISRDGRRNLQVLERGTMTKVWYRDKILDVNVKLYVAAVGSEFILMDDNARPRHTRVVPSTGDNCLKRLSGSLTAGLEPD
jgi:hypothetical protein